MNTDDSQNSPQTDDVAVIKILGPLPNTWRRRWCRRYYNFTARLRGILSIWYWKVRGRIWDRYNVIYIKTLPCAWTDRDEALLHANFAILTDFIEKELVVDWNTIDKDIAELQAKLKITKNKLDKSWIKQDIVQCQNNKELLVLYDWWQGYSKTWDISEYWQSDVGGAEIEKNLNKLIKLRGCLWT